MPTDPKFDRAYEVARKAFPLVAKRARELRHMCLEAKSVGQGLEAIKTVFEEIGTGELLRYPVNIVEVLYMRTFMACLDCLAAIEADMKKRGIPTDPVKVLAFQAGSAWNELLAERSYSTPEEAQRAITALDKAHGVKVSES